jgi:hypothetical protein
VQNLGKDWVAVAAMVPGRTNDQCRNRWFTSLDPIDGNTCKPRRGGWKAEEDVKLKEAVMKHGKEWFAVGKLAPGRKNEQCRYRWVNI